MSCITRSRHPVNSSPHPNCGFHGRGDFAQLAGNAASHSDCRLRHQPPLPYPQPNKRAGTPYTGSPLTEALQPPMRSPRKPQRRAPKRKKLVPTRLSTRKKNPKRGLAKNRLGEALAEGQPRARCLDGLTDTADILEGDCSKAYVYRPNNLNTILGYIVIQ